MLLPEENKPKFHIKKAFNWQKGMRYFKKGMQLGQYTRTNIINPKLKAFGNKASAFVKNNPGKTLMLGAGGLGVSYMAGQNSAFKKQQQNKNNF